MTNNVFCKKVKFTSKNGDIKYPVGEASNDGRVLFQVCPKRSGSEGVTGKNSIRVDEREMLKLVDSGEYSVRCRSELDQSKAVMLIRHARYEYELV
ncbi:MAG: hypothetical protein GYA32_17675 [Serratia sp.]|nr:hypothetical protein [Serratia sp. (in: enterobacteria)]